MGSDRERREIHDKIGYKVGYTADGMIEVKYEKNTKPDESYPFPKRVFFQHAAITRDVYKKRMACGV